MNRTAAMRLVCTCTLLAIAAHAASFPTQQGIAFTSQGLFKSVTTPINGAVDLQFRLFDAATAGTQVGSTVAEKAVFASKGVFTATLDFGVNNLEVSGTASKSAVGDWLANSDRRIKSDIVTIDNALETLDQVRLTSFVYSNAYLKSHPEIEQRRYLNVIAQEFAGIFPDHVKGSGEFLSTGEEILQVDTHPLTIYSAAAIQELHKTSITQQEDIEKLKRKQQDLMDNMDSLKEELDVRDLTIADLLKRLEALEKQAKEAKSAEPG